ncbi:WD repeat, SAM and U-box domain-containing protein 1 [Perkinsus olseni]|uniref:WD repeat, SAM and U-box domain-containing protein 1 n=1 Tax=Perkinsus olseni TaxID=32597 RepID=A0A7J6LZZ7_PEROL|nr:WD repeat, SAM and U-box domain-containing protein 1 [Perkinsus olseni]
MDGDDEALLKELVESFECPITQELMTDPVTLVETGFTYERSALRNAFKRRPKIDPLTNAPLRSQRVVPNRALKSAIETFTHATACSANDEVLPFLAFPLVMSGILDRLLD